MKIKHSLCVVGAVISAAGAYMYYKGRDSENDPLTKIALAIFSKQKEPCKARDLDEARQEGGSKSVVDRYDNDIDDIEDMKYVNRVSGIGFLIIGAFIGLLGVTNLFEESKGL